MLPLYPCGSIVDYLRSCYSSKIRPWINSDIKVPITWYFVPRDARPVPYPSQFCSFVWDDGSEYRTVGESRSRTTYSLGDDVYGMEGRSVCGTEEVWRNGGRIGTSPTVEIDAFGLSSCCGHKPHEVSWETGTEWSVSPHTDNTVSIRWDTGTEWSVSHTAHSDVSILWGTGTEWSVSHTAHSDVSILWGTGTEWSVSPHSDNSVSLTWDTGTEWSVIADGPLYESVTWETGTDIAIALFGPQYASVTWETGTKWSIAGGESKTVSVTWETGTDLGITTFGPLYESVTWETGTDLGITTFGPLYESVTWETGTEWEIDMTPVGSILPYGGLSAPSLYLLCDGASLLRADYPALYAVIGTTFGFVDGTHFTLPDLRRRVPMGAGGTQISGPGVDVGDNGGVETHTLDTSEIPSHTHPTATGDAAFLVVRAPGTVLASSGAGNIDTDNVTGVEGGGGSHNNVQPSLVLNYIIRY